MPPNVDARVRDLVSILQHYVHQLYPGMFLVEEDAGKVEITLRALAAFGLIRTNPSNQMSEWTETERFASDLVCALALNTDMLDTIDAVIEDVIAARGFDELTDNRWVFEDLSIWLSYNEPDALDAKILRKIAGYQQTTYEEAFARAFRLFYRRSVVLVAVLGRMIERGIVARREGIVGGEWSPTPYIYFRSIAAEDEVTLSVFRKLEQRGLLFRLIQTSGVRRKKAKSSETWRVTRAGEAAGLLSQSGHLLDLLESLGIRTKGPRALDHVRS